MQPLDVVGGAGVDEPLEGRLVARPGHPPQPVELLAGQPLDDPVGLGDLRVRVVDDLGVGRVLGEEHRGAAGEGLDVGLVGRQQRHQALGELLLAGGRAPDGLADRHLEAAHLVRVVVGGDEGDARAQPLALGGADARGVPPAPDVEALEQLRVPAQPVGAQELPADRPQHLGEAGLVPVLVAGAHPAVGVVAGVGRVEEEEGVGPVELLDDLLVVGAAHPDVLEPRGVPLELVHEAGLDAHQLVGQRAAPQLVEREPDQVGEAVEALQLVVRGIGLVELAEVRLVPDPLLAPQPGELLGGDLLGEAEGEGDLGVEVAHHLHFGGLLGEQHLGAAGEGLDVDAVLRDLGDDAPGQVRLARGRAPDPLRHQLGDDEVEHRPGALERAGHAITHRRPPRGPGPTRRDRRARRSGRAARPPARPSRRRPPWRWPTGSAPRAAR